MGAKLYRNIPVGDLPDADWVSAQEVPDDVPNVYTLWPGRAAIEVVAVWWDADAAPAGIGAAVYDAGAVTLQPVEVKSIAADDAVADVSAFVAVVAATSSLAAPAFEKQSLADTNPDAMYMRVAAATAPGTATHLRLLLDVTP